MREAAPLSATTVYDGHPAQSARAAAPAPLGSPAPSNRAVAGSELCVSEGRIEPSEASHLHVDAGGMRAVVAGDASSVAELDFTYLGPSKQIAPLANGELRRQIGVKLRAKDTCNVVYVMWHVEPTEGIHVSVKHNPGKSTHAACGDGGYISARAATSALIPRIRPNEKHRLRADIEGDVVRVLVDGIVAWKGSLPAEASTFDGPAGIRTDNGAFDFDLRVGHPRRAGARCAGH